MSGLNDRNEHSRNSSERYPQCPRGCSVTTLSRMTENASDPISIRGADTRIAWQLYILTAIAYAFFFGGGSWNPNAHFDLTRAIVEQGTIRINDYHQNTGDIVSVGDEIYANKAPGTSIIAAIPYAALILLERTFNFDPADPWILTLNLYICTVVVSGLMGALIPAFLYLYSRRRLNACARPSVLVALLVAFATPLFLYSSIFFLHVPNAALLLLAFYFSSGSSRKQSVLAGFFAGLGVLTNYLGALTIPVILYRVLKSSSDRIRSLVSFGIAAAPSALIFAAYQLAVYGDFFSNPVSANEDFRRDGAWLGAFQAPSFETLYGLTISPYRGLFYISPILVLAIGGGIVMWRQATRRLDFYSIAAIVAIFSAFNLTFVHWEGGWSVGPRFLIPIIPFLGLLMLYMSSILRLLWIVLGAVSFANNLVAVAVNHLVSVNYKNPLAEYIYPVLLSGFFPGLVPWPPHVPPASGHVSSNMESVAVPPLAGPWGSFNLGEFVFGAGDPLSLLPLVIFLLAGSWILCRIAQRLDGMAGAEHRDGGAPNAP